MAFALIASFLRAGKAGAESGQANPDVTTLDRKAITGASIGAGIAALGFPMAAAISGGIPAWLVFPILGGVALGVYLANFPKTMAHNVVLVPLAVIAGAGGALAWGLMSAFFTFLGGGDPSRLGLGIAWVATALFAYGWMSESAGRLSGNPVRRPDLGLGFLYSGIGSIATFLLLAYVVLPAEFA